MGQHSAINTSSHNLLTNIALPFCFLALFSLLDYLYSGISDKILRLYYHDYFTVFCATLIDLISPQDQVKVIQNYIISSKVNLIIVRTCDGSTALFLITSAILVFRASIKRTLIGILLGLVLILGINSIRIVALYFLKSADNLWFSYTHLTIAPFLLLTMSCAYFAFWAYYANQAQYDND